MNYKSNQPCVCCGLDYDGMVTYHHLMTRKAHPEHSRNAHNMISVCQQHHNEFHSKPLDEMAQKYYQVENWLTENNWIRLDYLKKWILKASEHE